jgi:hypothetical protein
MENLDQLCISYVEPIFTVSTPMGLVNSINKINEIAKTMDIPCPQIIASTEYESDKSRIMYMGHKDWVTALAKKLETQGLKSVGEIQNGLFITGFGITSSNFEADIFLKLSEAKLPILKYIRDSKGLLLVFLEGHKEQVTKFAESLIK